MNYSISRYVLDDLLKATWGITHLKINVYGGKRVYTPYINILAGPFSLYPLFGLFFGCDLPIARLTSYRRKGAIVGDVYFYPSFYPYAAYDGLTGMRYNVSIYQS